MYAVSPLRYPGAKWRLEPFISALLQDNKLGRAHYLEPYAGGASLALSLLFQERVAEIHLNDLDRSVWAFWRSLLDHPKEFVDRVLSTPINMDEWHKNRDIQLRKRDVSVMDLGFSTFFMNRTNRSGILTAGVIGGKAQAGRWLLDARFNRSDLVRRLMAVAARRTRIHVSRQDALTFARRRSSTLPERGALMFLDPPYYHKGQELYMNAYAPSDHANVASFVQDELRLPWLVSYDDVPEIRRIYANSRRLSYTLRYSASVTRKGKEAVFLQPGLSARPRLLQDQ